MEIIQYRADLPRTRRALERGSLKIGFTGGSITEQRVWRNWPEPVIAWLGRRFPQVRLQVENTAIGATGSDLANLLVDSHLIREDCDLVFVEFAVNDIGTDPGRRMRTREGLLRRLLGRCECDVVIVYTFCKEMYLEMAEGGVPASVADFEKLACHYGLNSVWMGRHALEEVMAGAMRWEEWLPDGLHPHSRGSLTYAQPVIRLMETVLDKPSPAAGTRTLPPPLCPDNWEKLFQLDFSRIRFHGPLRVRKNTTEPWFSHFIESSAVGSGITIPFTGTGLVLVFDYGLASCEYEYRLDGGPPQLTCRERPSWCEERGWYRCETLFEGLEPGEHQVEIRICPGSGENCTGTRFCLMAVGVIP